MGQIIRFVNFRSFPIMLAMLLVLVALGLALNGVSVIDLAILVAIVLLGYGTWRVLVSTQTVGIDSVRAIKQALQNGRRPTVIEFYSAYCAACLITKPIVDRLEQEAGERLQIIRLNIDDEPGKTLVQEHDVRFSPTFISFDANGNKQRESVGVIDRARILYDLETA